MLWGDAGDPVIELDHLKQPDEPVGPLRLLQDHARGTTTVLDDADAFTIVLGARDGATASDVGCQLYGDESRNSREKAKRQLDRLVREGRLHAQEGTRGGAPGREAWRYFALRIVPLDGESEER